MSSWTDVVLVRHGHTAGNALGLDAPMSGWADLPLSRRGFREAGLAAERLAREPRPVAVYSSPSQRAAATARILVSPRASELTLVPELREICCGGAEGLPLSEVLRLYPEHWIQNLAQSDPEFRWPGGERCREFRERCVGAVQAIAAAHSGQRVLVVTHAGVISQILGLMHGISAARWDCFRPRNGSCTEVLLRGDRIVLVRFDDVGEPRRRASSASSAGR